MDIFTTRRFGIPASLLILLDGVFHLSAGIDIFGRFGPDFIISGGGRGMPIWMHRVMGVYLIGVALWALWWFAADRKGVTMPPFLRFNTRYIYPFSFVVIGAGMVLANIR